MVEGRIAGPWVAEFNRTWHSLAPSLNSKKLSLDLRGVTFIDADGRRVLAEILRATGAALQTDSQLVDFLAKQAMRDNSGNGKEG